MKLTEYVTPLGYDGRRRTYHKRLQQNIIEFVVQYELFIEVNGIQWSDMIQHMDLPIKMFCPLKEEQ